MYTKNLRGEDPNLFSKSVCESTICAFIADSRHQKKVYITTASG